MPVYLEPLKANCLGGCGSYVDPVNVVSRPFDMTGPEKIPICATLQRNADAILPPLYGVPQPPFNLFYLEKMAEALKYPPNAVLPDTHGDPPWRDELTAEEKLIFCRILDVVDRTPEVDVDKGELLCLLRQLEPSIGMEHVAAVLRRMSPAGGTSIDDYIDFDVFLYTLAMMQGSPCAYDPFKTTEKDKDERQEYSRLQKLLLNAIADFTLKNTRDMKEVNKCKCRKPKVDKRTAAQRTIAAKLVRLEHLTARVLCHYQGIRSPYASPLPFMPRPKPRRILVCEEIEASLSRTTPLRLVAARIVAKSGTCNHRATVNLTERDFKQIVNQYAENGCVLAQLPEAYKLCELQDKLANINIYFPLCSSPRVHKDSPTLVPVDPLCQCNIPRGKSEKWKRLKMFEPQLNRPHTDLPEFRVFNYEKINTTPTDIAVINERLYKANHDYYKRLKHGHVRRAWKVLDETWPLVYDTTYEDRYLQVLRAMLPFSPNETFVEAPTIYKLSK